MRDKMPAFGFKGEMRQKDNNFDLSWTGREREDNAQWMELLHQGME